MSLEEATLAAERTETWLDFVKRGNKPGRLQLDKVRQYTRNTKRKATWEGQSERYAWS